MTKNEWKLLSSRTVNKIGNVLYDYGNSSWLASLGGVAPKYIGYYQLAEQVISIFLNPFGGAVADRFKRRTILLTTDFLGGILCLLLALLGNQQTMAYGLIIVNALFAISHAFSGTSFKSYVVTLVNEDRLVDFNAHLEIISKIISVSSPLFALFFVERFGIKLTLLIDSATFFLSFAFLYSIRDKEEHITFRSKKKNPTSILQDIKEGLVFIIHEKEVFFLLFLAAMVNFFIAGFNYLIPFSNQLFKDSSSYATLLSMGAIGSILGALLAKRFFKHSNKSILLAVGLSGLGLAVITPLSLLKAPIYLIVSGNLFFECFLTIFNIHFFAMVQKKVPHHLLGRVFSSIFTVATLFMPLAVLLFSNLPVIHSRTFSFIGLGIISLSILGYIYSRKFENTNL